MVNKSGLSHLPAVFKNAVHETELVKLPKATKTLCKVQMSKLYKI